MMCPPKVRVRKLTSGGHHMSKNYSDDLKLIVVEEYLDGKLGYRSLAKKYNRSDRNWCGPGFKTMSSMVKRGLNVRKENILIFRF